MPPSARQLTGDEEELVALAGRTIDSGTDTGPDEGGVHTNRRGLGDGLSGARPQTRERTISAVMSRCPRCCASSS